MTNKLLEIAEKAYIDISTSKVAKQDAIKALCEYFVEYALSKIPVYSDISKLKTMPGKSFPKESYLEEDGWNSARDEMEYLINEDYKSLNN